MWTASKNAVIINGVTKDQNTGNEIDVSVFGERSATVYTYISDKTVYFAFEVTDKNLYFNSANPQGRSSCVELYFTSEGQTEFKEGCYSVRINPTGKSGAAAANLGIYVPNDTLTEWTRVELSGKVAVAVKVMGKVQNTANDPDYSTDGNTGYIVEIAIDKSLIGINADSIRFTAAFVQDKGFTLNRLGNSFIEGTHYLKPEGWKVMTNDGIEEQVG